MVGLEQSVNRSIAINGSCFLLLLFLALVSLSSLSCNGFAGDLKAHFHSYEWMSDMTRLPRSMDDDVLLKQFCAMTSSLLKPHLASLIFIFILFEEFRLAKSDHVSKLIKHF